MNKQHRQYVILIVVLLACAASVFFGVRSILHSDDEMATFAVGDWEGITIPRYRGPAVYSTPAQQGYTVTLPMASTSSRSLFHHNAVATYRAGVTTAQRVQTSSGAYRVYQTSDQEMHFIGSGCGASGTASFGTTNYQQSTPSASFSVPTIAISLPSVRTRTQTLAVNSINIETAASSILADAGTPMATRRVFGPRRSRPDFNGEDGQTVEKDGETWTWDSEAQDWINETPIGTKKIVDDKVYEWNGSEWMFIGNQGDPSAPIGTIPWLMLLLVAAGYGYYAAKRKQKA